MKGKRILVLSWRDPKHPLAGGAEQVMHEHMKGWVVAGFEVLLFSSYFSGGKREESMDGVMIKRYGYELLGVHIVSFFWYLFVNKKKYDLVIDQFHGIPFFTPFYVKTKKLAVLQEIAREVWLMNHLPFPLNKIIGYIGYYLESSFFYFYKHIHFMTGSRSAKQDLMGLGIREKMITVVPHGVILDVPKNLPKKDNPPAIIFLGSLSADKGVEDALSVFSLLEKRGNFAFWVVGKGSDSYLNKLKGLLEEKGILEKVKFFGFVTQKEKFELLARSAVLINPSAREGWGLVNIEANSVGTPVVAYTNPGLVDSVKHEVSGLLCKENDPEEMAEEVYRLLINKDKYFQISKTSKEWSSQFNWNNSIKISLELLNKMGVG